MRISQSDDQITKIRSLLDSGEPLNQSNKWQKHFLMLSEQARSYFDDYMRNQEVGDVEKLANKHGADGANFYGLDALGEYFTEFDKFEDREVKRARNPADAAKEFARRYNFVADTYKPKGLSESAVPQEAKEKLFARMKRLHQVPTGATIEDAEFWEVKDGDYGFRDNKSGEITAIKANGKYYYGEI